MKRRLLLWSVGTSALVLALWFCFKPPLIPAEGFSPEEVSQIRWNLNSPLLFRSPSWYAVRTFPGDIWHWHSKNTSIYKIERQNDGSIHVCVKDKDSHYFSIMRKGTAGWELSGLGEW